MRFSGNDVVVVIEAKTSLKNGDIEKHIKKLSDFLSFFDEHVGKRVYGAMSSVRVDSEVFAHAQACGLLVLEADPFKTRVMNDQSQDLKNFGEQNDKK